MVLVETSVWIAHFRSGNAFLERLLIDGEVLCHPLIVGELACGNLKNRREILALLKTLPMTSSAENDEVLHFIENKKLMGLGLGIIDMHLLVGALLTNAILWTRDKKLEKVAKDLGVGYRS